MLRTSLLLNGGTPWREVKVDDNLWRTNTIRFKTYEIKLANKYAFLHGAANKLSFIIALTRLVTLLFPYCRPLYDATTHTNPQIHLSEGCQTSVLDGLLRVLSTVKMKRDNLLEKKAAAAAPNANTTLTDEDKLNLALRGQYMTFLFSAKVH